MPIKQMVTDAKARMRQTLDTVLKEHELSEDDEKHALAEVQKLTDQHIEEITAALKKKETEVMEV